MKPSIITPREQEILRLIAYEYSSREIAELLYISQHTVITHRINLMAKLEARNAAGLVRRGYEEGLLELNSKLHYRISA